MNCKTSKKMFSSQVLHFIRARQTLKFNKIDSSVRLYQIISNGTINFKCDFKHFSSNMLQHFDSEMGSFGGQGVNL